MLLKKIGESKENVKKKRESKEKTLKNPPGGNKQKNKYLFFYNDGVYLVIDLQFKRRVGIYTEN